MAEVAVAFLFAKDLTDDIFDFRAPDVLKRVLLVFFRCPEVGLGVSSVDGVTLYVTKLFGQPNWNMTRSLSAEITAGGVALVIATSSIRGLNLIIMTTYHIFSGDVGRGPT